MALLSRNFTAIFIQDITVYEASVTSHVQWAAKVLHHHVTRQLSVHFSTTSISTTINLFENETSDDAILRYSMYNPVCSPNELKKILQENEGGAFLLHFHMHLSFSRIQNELHIFTTSESCFIHS